VGEEFFLVHFPHKFDEDIHGVELSCIELFIFNTLLEFLRNITLNFSFHKEGLAIKISEKHCIFLCVYIGVGTCQNQAKNMH
jgi:hypothetical protein